mgnify:CR=1 FL=1
MGTHNTAGFTIIETMLVLAITGLLVAGVFAGVGTSINIQRYRDSVETLKNTLQNQYAELTSVRNDRNNNWTCSGTAATQASGAVIRGQSDCFLAGRLLLINGTSLTTYTIVGVQTNDPGVVTDDVASLRDNYALNVSTVSVERDTLQWGAQIAWPQSGSGSRNPTTPRQIAVLYVRSPDSGQIYTFTGDSTPNQVTPQFIDSLLVAGSGTGGQRERTICIDSGGLFNTDRYSIYIADYASVPNAIETRTNALIQTSGSTTRC